MKIICRLIFNITICLLIAYVITHLHDTDKITVLIDITLPDGFKDQISMFATFYGTMMGFLTSTVAMVFAILDKESFDRLFRTGRAEELNDFVFKVLAFTLANTVISMMGYIFFSNKMFFAVFICTASIAWFCEFVYFCFLFYTLIMASFVERNNAIKQSDADLADKMLTDVNH